MPCRELITTTLRRVLEEAEIAERERCAQIAESWRSPYGGLRDVEVAQAIAEKIRMSGTRGTSMTAEENEAIAKLEREARIHDAAAERLERDAMLRRRAAETARKRAEYIRKQRAT